MSMQNIRAIAFDLDGTLVDSLPDLAAAVNQMLLGLGHAAAELQQVTTWIGNGVPKLILRALSLERPETELGDAYFQQAEALFVQAYSRQLGDNSKLYDGVAAVLQQLQQAGYQLNLVTNKSQRFTLPLLQELGIAEYFSCVLSGDSLKQKKPDPAPLQHICQQLQLDVSQLLMVGDSENDIIAAQRAGCLSVAVSYGYNYGKPIAESRPDYLIDAMHQLPQLLEQSNGPDMREN